MITLENVGALLKWGPLIAKRDPDTGRVVRLDGTVAGPGERVPRREQFLVPDPKREGETWRAFVRTLERLGYRVEWRSLIAADYGAHTTSKRLFVQAVRDDQPIVWPMPTHASRETLAKQPGLRLQQYRPAHEIIDWNLPIPSIFDREKPLVEASCRRIAHGVRRFVIEDPDPFVMDVGRLGLSGNLAGSDGILVPSLMQRGYGERKGQAPRVMDIRDPMGTAVAGGVKTALVAAFMAQHNGGFNATVGRSLRQPLTTLTNTGSQQQLVRAELVEVEGDEDVDLALKGLSQEQAAGARKVAAFLMRYYGSGGQYGDLREPMATVTTKARLALVVVHYDDRTFVITDIGMRMLEPKELYAGQGMPKGYVFDRRDDGTELTKTAQIRMVGNSVSPLPMEALYQSILSVRQPLQMAA